MDTFVSGCFLRHVIRLFDYQRKFVLPVEESLEHGKHCNNCLLLLDLQEKRQTCHHSSELRTNEKSASVHCGENGDGGR